VSRRPARREDPNKVDFVASTALGGAFNVKLLGNQVTLVFTQNRKEAERIVAPTSASGARTSV